MKYAFTTILNDRYLSGFLITFNSILRTCPDFNHDLIIFEWGDLSEDSKKIIKNFYKNVTFKFVEVNLYEKHDFDETFRKWTYNCNYRFDIFTLIEYDKVVFFDCDIVFQINVNELLELNVDFGACLIEKGRIAQIGDVDGFEAGLMVIGKKYLGDNIRKDLINIANKEAPKVDFLKTTKWTSDEPILNHYFLDKLTPIDSKFNLIISEVQNENFKNKINYQYTGHNKPWYSNIKEKQFSKYTIQKISETNKPYMKDIILRKLIKIVEDEINDLNKKGIDIYKHVGDFYE
jgi:lipopolysaccharide biosynthesis glycosyltransferase